MQAAVTSSCASWLSYAPACDMQQQGQSCIAKVLPLQHIPCSCRHAVGSAHVNRLTASKHLSLMNG
jgi:hypothetical protein